MKVYFHSGCMFSGPCFEDTLKLWYLFLTWLLVSTSVAKCAISQKYCDKQGHSCGSFTQKQGNSNHYWWEVSGGQGRASASWECSVCSETGAHSFPASKPCSGLPAACTAEPCWQGFSKKKELDCGAERDQLMTNAVCWQLYPSGGKKKGDSLSRGYSHALNSCWQHRRNLKRECSQKWFFSCPSAPSKQAASAGVAAACCFFHVDLCQYIFGGEGLKQKEGFGLLRFLLIS